MYQKIFNFFAAAIGISVNYAFGGWSESLSFLGMLVIADYVTGISAAIKEGTGLNSNTGFWGICKKAFMFLVIAILHRADILIGTDVLMIGAIYFYIANELVSIIENLGRLNFPLPPQLKQIVGVLKSKGEQR
ncbi:phage holin family protein [Paenibacillus naphthalenovorans]|uniref:phage holin family protein n=1 Tax=Paenibacillus naphthalenovorans TaxID=162209 RepID=UPI003D26A234